MWTTATLVEFRRREGLLQLRIQYGRDDSAEVAMRAYEYQTAPDLRAVAAAEIVRLNRLTAAADLLVTGPIDLTPPAPTPQAEPHDDTMEDFLRRWLLLRASLWLVDLAIIGAADPLVTTLRAGLASDWALLTGADRQRYLRHLPGGR